MARTQKKARVHAHRCTCCGVRYEDACEVEIVGAKGGLSKGAGPDGLCSECVTGRPLAFWPEAREPKDCCREHSRPVRTEKYGKTESEKERYRLAGSTTWFICDPLQGGCARTHPYDPTTKRTRSHGTQCRARSRQSAEV